MSEPSSYDSEPRGAIQSYGLAIIATILAAVATILARSALFGSNTGLPPLTLFVVSAALSAWYGGLRAGITATVLGVAAAILLYLPSPLDFSLGDRDTQSRLLLFMVAAGLINALSESRTRAERRTRLQRAELRVTLESIGDAVISADRTGRIAFINPEAARLTGWSAEEALGRPLPDVFKVVG